MGEPSWKTAERRFARAFGSERVQGSGGRLARDKAGYRTRSDSDHMVLFLEHKHAKSFALITTWRRAAGIAHKEGKLPVLGLHVKGTQDSYVLCRLKDLEAVADECDFHRDDDPDAEARDAAEFSHRRASDPRPGTDPQQR